MGGPAILPLSLAKMAQLTRAFPDKAFSGIGGISEFAHALNYFLLGCGTVQVCTAAMLDHAIGPSVIARLLAGYRAFLETQRRPRLDEPRRLPRPRSETASSRSRRIRRPDQAGIRVDTTGRRATRAPDAADHDEGTGGRGGPPATECASCSPVTGLVTRHSWATPMSTTLVRNGTIVTASDQYDGDLYIDKGVITLIGRGLSVPADTVIDASGMLVMPGGVDVHTHLDMPFGGTTSADDFETGTIAAAHGGTTTLIDFAIQDFGQGLYPALDAWRQRAEGKSVIDYAFHMIVRELTEQVSIDMDRMVRQDGVTSFKLFMAYPGVFMVDDATIFKAMLRTRENGGLICMHAENGGVIDTLVKEALRKGEKAPKYHALTRPTRAEGEATGRAIALAEMAGVPMYIVHLSCADALEKVKQARDMGLPAYAETCPQYLFLSYDDYEREGFEGAKYVMSPPLREKWHQDVLWKGLLRNDLQVVSTDHCPFCMNEPPQKQLGAGRLLAGFRTARPGSRRG